MWSSEVQAADWLVQRSTSGQSVVSSVIPLGFAAYVRVLHPARALDGAHVRWAELAAHAHVLLEPGVQFEALQVATGWRGEPPTEGSLPADQLEALTTVLADFTSTPQRCWFGVWDGYGWLYQGRAVRQLTQSGQSASPPASAAVGIDAAPRVHTPTRDYVLYSGPLAMATHLIHSPWQQAPNLWWPDDHTWCVASEIDLPSTYIGGSKALVDRLLADARFEAVAAQPTDPLIAGRDQPDVGG
jgi:hypothetical protein